jgi:hydroxyacylglutathione hydrolase
VPVLKKLSASDLKEAMNTGMKVLDARDKVDFAAGFIPGSLNIQGNNAFATWAGWFLKYDEQFIILADESKLDDLTRKLMRIGLDNIYGYVPSTSIWTESGGKLEKANVISIDEAKRLMKEDIQIVDLRGLTEFNSGHIANADNVFVGTLPQNLDKISKDKKVLIHCQSGDRATIGYSILIKNGFTNISNYSGSINDWVNKGEPLVS